MSAKKMFVLQNIFLINIPITTILTTVVMLMPYWWSSEDFQIGLWRIGAFSSSSWNQIELETSSQGGRLLFILQLLSLISVVLTDLTGLVSIIIFVRRIYDSSLKSNLTLLFLTIIIYFCLSTLLFFVWYSTKITIYSIQLSYSFYLTIVILLIHTITLISITINIAKYQTNHRTIQPYLINEKVSFGFYPSTV